MNMTEVSNVVLPMSMLLRYIRPYFSKNLLIKLLDVISCNSVLQNSITLSGSLVNINSNLSSIGESCSNKAFIMA